MAVLGTQQENAFACEIYEIYRYRQWLEKLGYFNFCFAFGLLSLSHRVHAGPWLWRWYPQNYVKIVFKYLCPQISLSLLTWVFQFRVTSLFSGQVGRKSNQIWRHFEAHGADECLRVEGSNPDAGLSTSPHLSFIISIWWGHYECKAPIKWPLFCWTPPFHGGSARQTTGEPSSEW